MRALPADIRYNNWFDYYAIRSNMQHLLVPTEVLFGKRTKGVKITDVSVGGSFKSAGAAALNNWLGVGADKKGEVSACRFRRADIWGTMACVRVAAS